MSTLIPITLTELCFPDLQGKSISAWGTVNFNSGATYITGGLNFGLLAFADGRTIDFNGFLRCEVYGEDVITASVGGYDYHYSPVTDVLQIRQNGTELSNGAALPAGVVNDTVLFHATWDRTGTRG